jgi:hypothetical protein
VLILDACKSCRSEWIGCSARWAVLGTGRYLARVGSPRAKHSQEPLCRVRTLRSFSRSTEASTATSTTLQLEHPSATAVGDPIALGEHCARGWNPAHNYVSQHDRLAEGPRFFDYRSRILEAVSKPGASARRLIQISPRVPSGWLASGSFSGFETALGFVSKTISRWALAHGCASKPAASAVRLISNLRFETTPNRRKQS